MRSRPRPGRTGCKRGNLALLYARLADYPARARFLAIQSEVSRLERLSEAQRLLIQSGAVSYCLYHLIQRYRQATHLLGALALPNPEPVRQLLVRQMAPLWRCCSATISRCRRSLRQRICSGDAQAALSRPRKPELR